MRKLNYIIAFYNKSTQGIARMRDTAVWGNNGSWEEHDDIPIAQRGITAAHTAVTHYAPVGEGATATTQRVLSATHAQVLDSAEGVIRSVGLSSKDVATITAPLMSHGGFASMVAANKAHAKIVLPSKVFEPEATLAQMALHRSTVLVATPAQAEQLAQAAATSKHDISALRTGLIVGGQSPVPIGKAVLKPVNAARFPGAAAFA